MTDEAIEAAIQATITEGMDVLLLPDSDLHPAMRDVLRFFRFAHLPPKLAGVSSKFAEAALFVCVACKGAEATVALRKLLEAKDAAVRAAL